MITLAIAALLSLQEKDDVAAAVKKLADLKNYAFRGTIKMEGTLPTGGIADGRFEGAYDSASGLYMSTDTQEWVKIGDKMVTRPKQEWRPVESRGPAGALGGAGRSVMGLFSSAPRAPQDDLKDFASMIAGAKKLDKTEKVGDAECSLYECEMTAAAARERLPGGPMGRMLESAEISGSIRVWVDPNGAALRYALVTTVAATLGGRDIDVTNTRTVTLFDIDRAKPQIPEDAKKAIEGKKPREDE